MPIRAKLHKSVAVRGKSLKIRQLLKEFAIYGVGDILLRATSFITLPIYTRLFTPEDYGIWSFVATAVGLLMGILALGGDSVYIRFFFEVQDLPGQQLVTSTWLGFLAIWSTLLVIVCLPFVGFFSQWSFGAGHYEAFFLVALLAAPLQLMNQMCGQVLRNQFRASLFATLNTATTLLTIGLSLIVVLVFKAGVIGLIWGAFLAALLMLPVRLWSVRALLRPVFSLQLLGQLLACGIPLVPMSLAYWVFIASDRLVLGKLSTVEQVGLYAVANNMTSMLSFLNSAFGQAWSPHAIRIYETQRNYAALFFGRVLTYILIGFGLLCVGITTFAHEGLVILSTAPFYPAALAVGPLALGFMALASTQVTALSISLTKKTSYFLIFSLLAAGINLVLNLWLVPRWGMLAASWTTAFAYMFLTVGYLLTAQRLWPIVYEKRRSLIVIGLTLGFTIAAPLLPTFSLPVDLGLKLLYCLAYIALLVVFQVFEPGEWSRASTFFQTIVRSKTQSAA